MKIAVGTTSKQKLGYLKEILDELNIEAELIAQEVASEISEQPIDIIETKSGSINLARNAFDKCDDADLAMGIEVGYHPNESGDFEILCWATLIDKNGETISMISDKFLMPEFYQQILRDGRYMCDHMRQFITNASTDEDRALGEMLDSRKPFIQGAARNVLSDYLARRF